MKELSRLLRRMGIQRKYLFLLLLRAPFDALRTCMLAGLMKATFLCVESGDGVGLLKTGIIYGLLCAMLFLYNGTVWSIYAAFAAKVEAWLQKGLLDKMLGLSLRQVDSHRSGEWMTRLNGDIQAAFVMMNAPLNLPHVAVGIINTLLSSLLLLQSSGLMFGVAWLFILPVIFINKKIVLRQLPKWKEEAQLAMEENTSALRPFIENADMIFLYDAGELMLNKYGASSRRLMKKNLRIQMRNMASNVIMLLLGAGGFFTLLLMGYGLIFSGQMTFADVVYCFQVRGSVLAGVCMLMNCVNNIKANSVCVRRLNTMLEE